MILGVIFFSDLDFWYLVGVMGFLPFPISLKPYSSLVLSTPPIRWSSVSLASHLAPPACMIRNTLTRILPISCTSQATAAQSRGSAFFGFGIFSVLWPTGLRFKALVFFCLTVYGFSFLALVLFCFLMIWGLLSGQAFGFSSLLGLWVLGFSFFGFRF